MKIGIIGTGSVAKTLAIGLTRYGHAIMLGSRSPDVLRDWTSTKGKTIAVGSRSQAAEFGELLILAVKGAAAVEVVKHLGKSLDDKVVIDVCNPIKDGQGPEEGVVPFFTGPNESLMGRLQAAQPKAHFVKAWNSVGASEMIDPSSEGRPSMFTCGNSEEAKKSVSALLESVGWEVVDLGSAKAARGIEPLCVLWCSYGFKHETWNHSFKLLR